MRINEITASERNFLSKFEKIRPEKVTGPDINLGKRASVMFSRPAFCLMAEALHA
jgi:hypothetical protein